jgi:hypothetical protein
VTVSERAAESVRTLLALVASQSAAVQLVCGTLRQVAPDAGEGPELRNNYVLVDYENVQPPALAALGPAHFKVFVFLGPTQTKIPIEFASVMQAKGSDAEYVRMSGSGKNALDFHVAFYLGRLTSRDPDGFFHVVSKDTGFDPLIAFLRGRKLSVSRSASTETMPCFRRAAVTDEDARLELVVADFRKRGAAAPRTTKTLANTINAVFSNELDAVEVERLIEALQRSGIVVVKEGAVTYDFNAAVAAAALEEHAATA